MSGDGSLVLGVAILGILVAGVSRWAEASGRVGFKLILQCVYAATIVLVGQALDSELHRVLAVALGVVAFALIIAVQHRSFDRRPLNSTEDQRAAQRPTDTSEFNADRKQDTDA